MAGEFKTQDWERRYRHFHREIAFAIRRKITDIDMAEDPSITDFGAGVGLYAECLRRLGIRCYAYDGTPNIFEASGRSVIELDLSLPQSLPKTQYGMSIEVMEHIPKELHPAYVRNISDTVSKGLFISVATPGQRGRGHISCMEPEEVCEAFNHWGWKKGIYTTVLRHIVPKPFDKKILYLQKEIQATGQPLFTEADSD